MMEVILFHICKLWRSIALDLPTLWTTFRFVPPGPSRHHVTTSPTTSNDVEWGSRHVSSPYYWYVFFSPTILIYFRDTFTYERRRQVSREREKGTEGRWRIYFWLYVCPTAFVLWRNVLTRLRNRDGGTAKLLLPRQSLTVCQTMRSMPLRLYIPRGKEISERGDSYVDSTAKGARDTGTCCLLIAFFDTLY